MKTRILLICLSLCALAGAAFGQASQRDENRLLEAELALAKKNGIYFVFDLEAGKLYLKARGATQKEMTIQGHRLWGAKPPIEPVALIKKSTLIKPKRSKIDPEKEKEKEQDESETPRDTFEVEALELKDMPSTFRLGFDKGISISVGPAPEGFFTSLCAAGRWVAWYLTRPIFTVWHAVFGKPYTSIDLKLPKDDARALYWAFPEGTEAVVYAPRK